MAKCPTELIYRATLLESANGPLIGVHLPNL
jgi:hypothetical protein